MSDLRERVAKVACDAVNGEGAFDETGTLHRERIWYPVSDAAIAIVLEEAARVVVENYQELCTEHRLLLLNRAAAIRALKSGNDS